MKPESFAELVERVYSESPERGLQVRMRERMQRALLECLIFSRWCRLQARLARIAWSQAASLWHDERPSLRAYRRVFFSGQIELVEMETPHPEPDEWQMHRPFKASLREREKESSPELRAFAERIPQEKGGKDDPFAGISWH